MGDWLAAERLSIPTFRSAGAATDCCLLVLGPRVIRWLQYLANQEYEDMAREGGECPTGSAKMYRRWAGC